MRTLVLLFMLCPMMSFALDRLAALSMIESADNDRLVGRAGEISRYQILKREWRSVTNSTRFTDRKVAEEVTRKLVERRVATFRSIYRREPTDFEFYGLWNAPAQVYKGKVSRVVAERCRRYANLCALESQSVAVAAASRPPALRPAQAMQAAPTPAAALLLARNER